jgi:hypothetical protein
MPTDSDGLTYKPIDGGHGQPFVPKPVSTTGFYKDLRGGLPGSHSGSKSPPTTMWTEFSFKLPNGNVKTHRYDVASDCLLIRFNNAEVASLLEERHARLSGQIIELIRAYQRDERMFTELKYSRQYDKAMRYHTALEYTMSLIKRIDLLRETPPNAEDLADLALRSGLLQSRPAQTVDPCSLPASSSLPDREVEENPPIEDDKPEVILEAPVAAPATDSIRQQAIEKIRRHDRDEMISEWDKFLTFNGDKTIAGCGRENPLPDLCPEKRSDGLDPVLGPDKVPPDDLVKEEKTKRAISSLRIGIG